MLCRVAENIYWMARYLERAENMARLLIVTTHALLDAPIFMRNDQKGGKGSDFLSTVGYGTDWPSLVIITGGQDLFARSGQVANEESVMRFMTCDKENPSSILSSLFSARENLRTTRDLFPRKAMEYLNAMYLGFKEQIDAGLQDEGILYKTLDHVIQDSQKITGLLFGTMSRNSAFEFFRLGQIIERADMTTRILDVGGVSMRGILKDPTMLPFINSIWLNILRALSGEQMYRHHVNPRIRLPEVLTFLLMDEQFPRAFNCCLGTVSFSLTNLVNNEAPLITVSNMKSTLHTADLNALLQKDQLPAFLDQLQKELGHLCDEINRVYFPTLAA
ncbi:MAG: alpha-E domain-containing protein [Magnetococcales bacterium]|nr:alpha-E domain-containing protein [Magnetococcales bacterium]